MVVDVLCTWGVAVRVLVAEPFPPFLMVVPRSQLLPLGLLDILVVEDGGSRSLGGCAGASLSASNPCVPITRGASRKRPAAC